MWRMPASYITLAAQIKAPREAERDSSLSPFHMGKGFSDAQGKAVIKKIMKEVKTAFPE